MLPLLAAAIPAAVNGIASYLGGREQNISNAQQADKQMRFQERMSNTQYQRGVQDMRAAGLNPALAYQQGGASSPSGASATMQNTIAPAAGAAVSTAQALASIAATGATIRKTEADAQIAETQSRLLDTRSGWETAMLKQMWEAQGKEWRLKSQDRYFEIMREMMENDLKISGSSAKATQLMLPELQNRANMQSTWFGRYISPFISDAKGVAGMISQFRR